MVFTVMPSCLAPRAVTDHIRRSLKDVTVDLLHRLDSGLPHEPDEDFLYQIIDVVGLANAFGKVSNERHAVAAVQVCKERLPAAGSGGIGVRALRRRQHGICYMAVTCWTEGHLDVSRPSKNELRISLSIVRSCASYYFTPGTHRYFCGQPAR